MPKNSKPDEFGEECLPGGPNGWCKRHRYPWAMCAAVAARRDEEGGVMAETPEREVDAVMNDVQRDWQYGCVLAVLDHQSERLRLAALARDHAEARKRAKTLQEDLDRMRKRADAAEARLAELHDGLEKWREAAERVRQIDEVPRRW